MILGFIFEFLFEVVIELLVELVFQVLGDAVFRPLWRRFGSKRVERILVGLLVGLVSFGYGFAWGAYRADAGAQTLPQSVWVAIALAAAFGLAALFHDRLPGPGAGAAGPVDLRSGRIDEASGGPQAATSERIADAALPWRWSRDRLAHFALVNVVIAAGIAAGYQVWG